MRKEKSCGGIIYITMDGDNYFLLIQQYGGHWSFPKGHVEKGETETETALREIKEETNLDVTLDTRFRVINTYSPKQDVVKDVIYFLACATNSHYTPQTEEVANLGWFKYEEALEKITYDADKKLLYQANQYLKGIPNEI